MAINATSREGRDALRIELGDSLAYGVKPRVVLALLDRLDELDPPPVAESDVIEADRKFLNYVGVYAHRLREGVAALATALAEAQRMGDSLEETAGVLSIAVEDRQNA